MACGCTKEAGERPHPMSQCTECAKKHFDDAYASYREFSYEVENRAHIHGQLRSLVNHTYKAHRTIAEAARELARLILYAEDDAETDKRFAQLGRMVDAAFYAEHPEVPARLEKLKSEQNKQRR